MNSALVRAVIVLLSAPWCIAPHKHAARAYIIYIHLYVYVCLYMYIIYIYIFHESETKKQTHMCTYHDDSNCTSELLTLYVAKRVSLLAIIIYSSSI